MAGENRLVPAPADAEIPAFGNDVYDTFIPLCKPVDHTACTVSGVVLHDNNIKIKAGSLAQRTFQSIPYGPFTIFNRYDARYFPAGNILYGP